MSNVEVLEVIESKELFRQVQSGMKITRVGLHEGIVGVLTINVCN